MLSEYDKYFSLEEELARQIPRGKKKKARGANVVDVFTVDFTNILLPTISTFVVERLIVCRDCEGHKVIKVSDGEECPYCFGFGTSSEKTGDVCPRCCGTGIASSNC